MVGKPTTSSKSLEARGKPNNGLFCSKFLSLISASLIISSSSLIETIAFKDGLNFFILSKYKPTISFTETSFFLIKEIISLTDLFSSMGIYYYLAFLMDARVISFISSKVAFLGFCP